ncbi:MAG: bifunctional DNA-formamidopyrimidine glycosylase/DNA-(apurinic or apyrimidinic site) lyase [Burkholderiales bacterium]|nr:bifunctional DNA-formamidopyrimidine glycosylase/DNA-(apurinic or apyrimidinic site) lyase [Burkholderiales bacterium]
MPELPEVETVKNGIYGIKYSKIANVIIRNSNLRYKISSNFMHQVMHKQIIDVQRRGKYLILNLNQGNILIHLGMSGAISLLKKEIPVLKKHDHYDIQLTNEYVLRYNDPRRFGFIVFEENLLQSKHLINLGPEPLNTEFNANYLAKVLHTKKSTIKQLIMNNNVVVGVGNIYASESLFKAKISPLRIGSSLKKVEVKLLVQAIKEVLAQAIMHGGSSLRDYKQADGNLGYFQNSHSVYNKAGQPCLRCNSIILEIRLGQRNSFYCAQCQK